MFMLNQGFKSNKVDEYLYQKKTGDKLIICLTYVDDFLIATDGPDL